MKILIAIPHVFNPIQDSNYSSNDQSKKSLKINALINSTQGNLIRHGKNHFVHASKGLYTEVFTRMLESQGGNDIKIQLFTPKAATLSPYISKSNHIEIIEPELNYLGSEEYTQIPLLASQRLLEQANEYDIVCYMEDDLLIEDRDFFSKLLYLDSQSDGSMAFMPHRCEYIPAKGDVILSGDPDGGRPDLFWDTGEKFQVEWPLGNQIFYRATNPHSGCYFLTKRQALKVKSYWLDRKWIADYELSGPLEQAGSGLLLPVLKIMKPLPSQYRFFMVQHLDELWKRHPFE
tara:strand:+ start:1459 stop:2328 length:870 start_codon:yes stop_codon:yes gene_type:complete